MAVLKRDVTAAGAAAGLSAAEVAAVWTAVTTYRTAARAATPRPTTAAQHAGEIAAAVAAVPAAKSATFAAALPAPAPTTPATPPSPTPTPAPTPVPPQYAKAVERAIVASGMPEATRAAARTDFADAIATGETLEEALTCLFEGRGLSDEAIAKGRRRFAGLQISRWGKVKENLLGFFSSKWGWAQLLLLAAIVVAFFLAPVPGKALLVILFMGILWVNLWFSDRRVLVAVNVAFIALMFAVTVGPFSGGGGNVTNNYNYGQGVGDSTVVATLPPVP